VNVTKKVPPPVVERTCRYCLHKPFRSIKLRKAHELAEHRGEMPLVEAIDFARASSDERDMLAIINEMARVVVRGPSNAELAERCKIAERTVRWRLLRLRKRDLVTSDPDGGVLLTPAAARLIAPQQRKEA
jgi:hypothetical protein